MPVSARKRRNLLIGAVAAAVSGAAWGAARLARPRSTLPTAEVRLGEFVDYLQIRGDLKATKSVLLNAPAEAGGQVQIIKLSRNGAMVRQGEVVAEFDASTLRRTLDEKRSELKQAEQEIRQTAAQGHMTGEQDQSDLLKARYDVERARLEVSKQEIVSRIEAEESKAKLADAEQKLREVQQKVTSDKLANAADIEAKRQKRDKALFEVSRAERQIAAMKLTAPANGMVVLMPNWGAGGFFTDNPPEYKEGDRAWPGAPIAELPDLSTLRMSAHVDETDRGRLRLGQSATLRVDAVPDKEISGRVTEISTLAKLDFSSWPPAKNFDLTMTLDQTDSRLRPGMSATARVAVERLASVILIPSRSAFQKGGTTVVYVRKASRFEQRVIEALRRDDNQIAVAKGVRPGERVALEEPEGAVSSKQ